mmetsp:Transcript_11185/g.35529  ORF Transcript_11185/g.35529 Transcript_11185/m.35529 type:complete len:257 (+) Transcript_11185:1473-2243(+)
MMWRRTPARRSTRRRSGSSPPPTSFSSPSASQTTNFSKTKIGASSTLGTRSDRHVEARPPWASDSARSSAMGWLRSMRRTTVLMVTLTTGATARMSRSVADRVPSARLAMTSGSSDETCSTRRRSNTGREASTSVRLRRILARSQPPATNDWSTASATATAARLPGRRFACCSRRRPSAVAVRVASYGVRGTFVSMNMVPSSVTECLRQSEKSSSSGASVALLSFWRASRRWPTVRQRDSGYACSTATRPSAAATR